MASIASKASKKKTTKRKRSSPTSSKKPTIFIMWSCDPPPDPTTGQDITYDKRIENDAKGLQRYCSDASECGREAVPAIAPRVVCQQSLRLV